MQLCLRVIFPFFSKEKPGIIDKTFRSKAVSLVVKQYMPVPVIVQFFTVCLMDEGTDITGAGLIFVPPCDIQRDENTQENNKKRYGIFTNPVSFRFPDR